MDSFVATTCDPSIYINYVNVKLSIDKLDRCNYDTWASNIKLYHKSQSYVDHLTQNVATIAKNELSYWLKIHAQLCIVPKSTIHSSLKQIFYVVKKYYSFQSHCFVIEKVILCWDFLVSNTVCFLSNFNSSSQSHRYFIYLYHSII